jgi:Kef-type K+ transport system membrane component KefB
MIALVILSQLSALTGDITVAGVVIPIVSALLYLIVGGLAAIFILPVIINKYILVKFSPDYHARVELTILFGLLLALMPATYYSKASFLMGAFISGLTFCSSHDLHHLFVSQFKRVLQWLMRIFFASTIG